MIRCISTVAMALLAGCSGGAEPGKSSADRYAELYSQYGMADPSDPVLLPITGGADYAGISRLSVPVSGQTTLLHGTLQLSVQFSPQGGSVSGQMSNFESAGEYWQGELQLAGGAIDRTVDPDDDYVYSATLDGLLTSTSAHLQIEGHLYGDFVGRNHDGVRGILHGTVTQGSNRDIFDGAFVGERQAD